VDSLYPEILGSLWRNPGKGPEVIICPSLSPSVELFQSSAALVGSKDALFAYVNTASFGDTSFQLPPLLAPYLQGFVGKMDHLPRNVEGVLEVEADPHKLFAKRGSIQTTPVCTHPLPFPLVYRETSPWLPRFDSFRRDLIEWLDNSERDYAMDWIDSFLAEGAAQLPEVVVQNLKYLRHSIIPLFDGNLSVIQDATELVRVSNLQDTPLFWSKRVNLGLRRKITRRTSFLIA
jgi:hypothetical protein